MEPAVFAYFLLGAAVCYYGLSAYRKCSKFSAWVGFVASDLRRDYSGPHDNFSVVIVGSVLAGMATQALLYFNGVQSDGRVTLGMFFWALVAAPLIGEILFRKILFGGFLLPITARWSKHGGLALSLVAQAGAFALVHLFNGPGTLIPRFVGGLLSGIVYYRFKSLSGATAAHFGGNLFLLTAWAPF